MTKSRATAAFITVCVAALIAALQYGYGSSSTNDPASGERRLEIPAARAQDALPLIATGLTQLENRAFRHALNTFRQAMLSDEQQPLAHLGFAIASVRLGDSTTAVAEYKRALDLAPDLAMAHNGLGIALLNQAQLDEAGTSFQIALQYDPSLITASLHLAYLSCLKNLPDLALGLCRSARESGLSDPFLEEVLGLAYSLKGDYDQAISHLSKELDLVQSSSRAVTIAPYLPENASAPPVRMDLSELAGQAAEDKEGEETPAVSNSGQAGGLSALAAKTQENAAAIHKAPSEPSQIDDFSVTIEGDTTVKNVSEIASVVAASNAPAPIQYVTFAIDGELKSVTNQQPFRWAWDTDSTPDGTHRLQVIAFGSSGTALHTWERTITVHNGKAASSRKAASLTDNPEELTHLQLRFRNLLRLQPDVLNTRYLLGKCYEAKGLPDFAYEEFQKTFLARPDYLDARQHLLKLRGQLEKVYTLADLPEIWMGTHGEKRVALTFDDGPHPAYTPKILELLRQHHAKGTFFLVGKMVERYPDLVKQIAQDGHELANHSYSHPNLDYLTMPQIQQEVLRTEVAITRITPRYSRYFRPPGGHYNDMVRQALADLGYSAIFWTANIMSFSQLEYDAIVRKLLNRTSNGTIILLHNGKDKTVPILESLLVELKKRNYKMVTVSEILKPSQPATVAAQPLK